MGLFDSSGTSRLPRLVTVALIVLALLAVLTASLITCTIRQERSVLFEQGSQPEFIPSLETTRSIVVGGDWDYPPFEFINARGEPDGFNIAILNHIALIMGLDITIELTSWAEARRRIQSGEIDMLAGMYRSPEREDLHEFTVPHLIASYGIFVRKGSPITGPGDLGNAVILVQEGDLGHDYALTHELGREIVTVRDWTQVLKALSDGTGDCAIFGMGQGMREIRQENYTNLQMLHPPLFRRPYGMAVRKGDAELLAILNEGLSILNSTGLHDTIYQEWFGVLETPSFWQSRTAGILLALVGGALAAVLWSAGWIFLLRRQVARKTSQLQDALAQAEQANNAKSRFLASVSHELRTPLQGIMGMIDLLGQKDLDQEAQAQIHMLRGASEQLLRVLSDLLDVSRITVGTLSVKSNPFDLPPLVQWLEQTLHLAARQKGLHFSFSCQDLPRSVVGDQERIAQIVINLASNAIKFTPQGEVSVSFVYRQGRLFLTVQDTGPGLTHQELSRIFDPFVQLDQSSPAKTAGLGLGLSIVHSVVDLLGGEITVESEPGKGTTFHLSVPLPLASSPGKEDPPNPVVIPPEPGPPPRATAPARETASLEGLRLLVAEDEAINRLYLVRILEQQGCLVTATENGQEALNQARQNHYDLILMDVSMPEMDGIEATRAIRQWEQDQNRKPQPIIALTAHAFADDITLFLEAGMNSYVPKPYKARQLLQEISNTIEALSE
ncbi:Signal transduction histidine kinase [Alkalispirochaeta americana]|uniref:histidine kinase n=1 Tax=Alkalispirochaeta americana TaxID=159291 RepID=A0A1N6VET2_9SPIO|nr:transporter substrate-binding domain-containing protein [Alkalispirochaeta americana]SIQ76361.1 Signal transduction histidine kinase [Alkalispirochaeta americana]